MTDPTTDTDDGTDDRPRTHPDSITAAEIAADPDLDADEADVTRVVIIADHGHTLFPPGRTAQGRTLHVPPERAYI